MSLLDDALSDIQLDQVTRQLARQRIGSGPKDCDSVQSIMAQANAAAARMRKGPGNNFASFTDGGYLVQVIRQTCDSCHAVSDHLVGLFHVELHESGSRRLTRLGRGAQFPIQSGHKVELTREQVPLCSHCLALVGFDQVVEPYTGRSIKHEG